MDNNIDKKYCYPNSSVLKNKYDIKNETALEQMERNVTHARMAELEAKPIKGNFDLAHLQKIHKAIFQDVYEWAGKIRSVDIGKGATFCLSQFIEPAAEDAFKRLKKDGHLKGMDKEPFIEKIADYMGEVNALHPFREGNGRTQRTFFEQLANEAGYELNITKWDKQEQLQADSYAMAGRPEKLIALLKSSVTRIEPKLEKTPMPIKKTSVLKKIDTLKQNKAAQPISHQKDKSRNEPER